MSTTTQRHKVRGAVAPIFNESDGYIIEYPKALEFEDKQQDFMWTAKEIAVEDDLNDIKVHCTEAERTGILTVLKLFTKYEIITGQEYWGSKFTSMFPRVEFQRMGTQFAQVELCVHAPFYDKINKVLMVSTPEFYNSWKDDCTLRERISMLNFALQSNLFNGLLSLAVFSILEGAVLYSSFAFLKSFKKGGKNIVPNIVSGINFSIRDENLHSEAGAWAFKTALAELNMSETEKTSLTKQIISAGLTILCHEAAIIEKIYAGDAADSITSISEEELKDFVKHRVALCLKNLGINPDKYILYKNSSEFGWFYDDVTGARSTDHFATLSSNYSMNWSKGKFKWKK